MTTPQSLAMAKAPLWWSVEQVADLAYGVGMRGDALAMAVAVARPESGNGAPPGMWANMHAVGDTRLETAKWGPSIGGWQVRSVNAERSKGTTRDELALAEPGHQARAMREISGDGRSWQPWTTARDGKHRPYLAEARKAAAAREAQGGTGSVGASSSSGSTTGAAPAAEVSPDVTIPTAALAVNYVAPRAVRELVVSGWRADLDIAAYVLDGDVELTTGEVSELGLTLLEPDGTTLPVHVANGVRWRDLDLRVAALERAQRDGLARLLVTARSAGAQRLKDNATDSAGRPIAGLVPGVQIDAKNLSPTEYAQVQATKLGLLRFVGEGSARRTDIAPARDDDGVYESPWEVIQRLASDIGFWAFEAAGTLYFGRPSWLVTRTVAVPVGWGAYRHDPAIGAVERPNVRDTEDGPGGFALGVELALPRWRGEQVRPGMRVVPMGWTAGRRGKPLIVTRVSWPVDGGIEPVRVEAVEAVDPRPADKALRAAANAPAASSPAPSSTASSSSGARGGRVNTARRIAMFGQPGDRARYVTVRTPWGMSVTCHRDVQAQFVAACDDANRSSSWRPRNIGSLSVRKVRGGDDWSLHAFALAWDIFDTTAPADVWGPKNAPDAAFRDAFKRHGFYLGAEFSNRKDYPHIEWAADPPASPSSARATAA